MPSIGLVIHDFFKRIWINPKAFLLSKISIKVSTTPIEYTMPDKNLFTMRSDNLQPIIISWQDN